MEETSSGEKRTGEFAPSERSTDRPTAGRQRWLDARHLEGKERENVFIRMNDSREESLSMRAKFAHIPVSFLSSFFRTLPTFTPSAGTPQKYTATLISTRSLSFASPYACGRSITSPSLQFRFFPPILSPLRTSRSVLCSPPSRASSAELRAAAVLDAFLNSPSSSSTSCFKNTSDD